MAIDVEIEDVITLTEASWQIPGRKKAVSLCTMHRWRLKGFRGIKLECVRIGLEWQTSREAILRFIKAMNPVVTPAEETPTRRSKRCEAAKSELAAMGIK